MFTGIYHVGYWTDDIQAAIRFYQATFGAELFQEALGPDGKALSLPILNEENGQTETVAMWGVRVPEAVYRSVEADKRDDGIIQHNLVGFKQYGFLEVNYAVPVLGGAVTRW